MQRLDSGRLQLTEVSYISGAVCVEVQSLEHPSLHQYAWERFITKFSEASLIDVKSVELELLSTEGGEGAEGATDTVSVVQQLRVTMAGVEAWLPPLKCDELLIRTPSGAPALIAREIRLSNWHLAACLENPRLPEPLIVEASLTPQEIWTAQVVAEAIGLDADLTLSPTEQGFDLNIELHKATETAVGVITFIDGHLLPERAEFSSRRITIDSEWLPAMQSLEWKEVAISEVDLRWEDRSYIGALKLQSEVVAGEQPSVPVDGSIEFSGDLETLRLGVFQLNASWGQLSLSQPLEIRLEDGNVSQFAELKADVDLSRQSFVSADGRVEASLRVVPSLATGPNVSFELSATDFAYDTYEVARVDVLGRLEGTDLSVERLFVQPLPDDDGGVELSGRADFSTKTLDFNYKVFLSSDWINGVVDQVTVLNALETSGHVSGNFTQPMIAGELAAITVEYPGVKPVTVKGNYKSDGVHLLSFDGSAAAAGAVIDAAFRTHVMEDRISVEVDQFTWTDPVRPTLKLMKPTRLSYQFSGPADFPESRLVVEPFHLAAPELEIQGGWSVDAGLDLLVSNVDLQRVGRWVNRELPSVAIESVALSLSELRPWVVGSVEVHMESRAVGEAAPLRVDLTAQLTSSGLQVEAVECMFSGEPLLKGAIVAPVAFQLPVEDKPFWQLFTDGDLVAELSGSVTPAFSDWLLSYTNVKVSEARLDLNVQGTIQKPVGLMEMSVASLESPATRGIKVDRIEISARAERDEIQLERFKFLINQSEVAGVLRLPTEGFAGALMGEMDQRKEWFGNATGRVELVDWAAEDWIDFLPALMRRSGRLSGSLSLKPGWDLAGNLSFKEFALRPTDSLPSIDLIGGQVELSNRMLTVDKASAQVGGSSVAFTGWLNASDLKRPLWEFSVNGLNVPLVRTTDMILRSDLNIQASHTNPTETPLISGALKLRSSTMLVEFDPLAPNVETGPRSKPPFFSISEPTLADWRFDIKITGDSFMRVRSPYFRTQLSADFDLGGTFDEPLLIGSVRTVDGELRFPGAKMRITNGEAYIEQGQPNALQLDFNGIAQKTSHIITMDVTQSLDDPHIQFQSTPTLSNAAIVRLLTTGSTTGGGVGTVGLYLGQGLLGAGGMEEQFSDRVTVDVGEETSRSGRNTVGVRYDLSEDVFLEGAYDVYDAYNLDLIWSIFKR